MYLQISYSLLITICLIISIIYTIYNKIRYVCLKEAMKKVANIEKMTNLTGEEKFALVVTWIDDELPRFFKNKFMHTLIEILVQTAYDNSFKYAKNYIKRKTGYDISEIINEMQEKESDNSENK